jgi:excinuclease ABC A subunit
MSKDVIEVTGAEEHNLKDVDVEIPREELTVVTGLSGSGKSSLAFETVYAEGQRRYIESLSAYARNFLGQMDKPQVENVEGLSPAISIDQKNAANNPRSTVGTVTELHDYLRLLYARVGVPHCPECGRTVGEQSAQNMVTRILELPEGTRLKICAPVVRDQKGAFEDLFDDLVGEGYSRVEVDGETYDLTMDRPDLDENYDHTVDVVVDRVKVDEDARSRINDSVETALTEADGTLKVVLPDPPADAEELLGRIDEPIGIVTHSQTYLTEPVLDRLDITDWFDTVVCCDGDLGWKPDPAPVELALSELGATTGHTSVLGGDSPSDVGAAWNAGLDAVHVERFDPYWRGHCVRADQRVERLDELV